MKRPALGEPAGCRCPKPRARPEASASGHELANHSGHPTRGNSPLAGRGGLYARGARRARLARQCRAGDTHDPHRFAVVRRQALPATAEAHVEDHHRRRVAQEVLDEISQGGDPSVVGNWRNGHEKAIPRAAPTVPTVRIRGNRRMSHEVSVIVLHPPGTVNRRRKSGDACAPPLTPRVTRSG